MRIYQEYLLYPKIIQDLSFILNNKIIFHQLKYILYLNGNQILLDIQLLDKYSRKSIQKNHTSLCLQLIFQFNEKTLKNKTVERVINNLKNILLTKFNVVFRV